MGPEELNTIGFDDLRWLPPVATVDDLPALAYPGSLCFVKDEDAVYAFADGAWIVEARGTSDATTEEG